MRYYKNLFLLLLIIVHLTNDSNAQYLTPVAGVGINGFSGDGGPANSAKLNVPSFVCTDRVGNVYISDASNARIRRVDAKTGVITTVAGDGNFIYYNIGEQATAAGIGVPGSICVDDNNLYISSNCGSCIDTGIYVSKVDLQTGIITNIAGNGTSIYPGDSMNATQVGFSVAVSICLDGKGNLFIADKGHYAIRKLNLSSGIITTVAGNGAQGYTGDGGPAVAAEIGFPIAIGTDAEGSLYISSVFTDFVNIYKDDYIRKVDASTGIISTLAGNGTDNQIQENVPALSTGLASVGGMFVDGPGNIYLMSGYSPSGSISFRKINWATGIISTIAGDIVTLYDPNGEPTQDDLKLAGTFCLDPAGNIYLTEVGGQYNGSGYPVNLVKKIISCKSSQIGTQPVDDTLCEKGNVLFKVGATNSPGYQWQQFSNNIWTNISDDNLYSGASTNSLMIQDADSSLNNTYYRCQISDNCQNPVSIAALLTVLPFKTIPVSLMTAGGTILGTAGTLCNGDSLVLFPGDYAGYLWQDGSTQSHYTVGSAGSYSVLVTGRCSSGQAGIIINEKKCDIQFPSAFTPNKDGLNDIFRILNYPDLNNFSLSIYNRWGQKVFETKDPSTGWNGNINGQPSETGVYVWFCSFKKSGNAGATEMKGTVVLIR